jgi:hypothetical protein
MEEGVLAQLGVLLDTKDQEIKRLRDEKEARQSASQRATHARPLDVCCVPQSHFL